MTTLLCLIIGFIYGLACKFYNKSFKTVLVGCLIIGPAITTLGHYVSADVLGIAASILLGLVPVFAMIMVRESK